MAGITTWLKSGRTLLAPALNFESISFCRYITYRQQHQRRQRARKKKNPFVKRFTDFIKHACITLVKYERLQTTLGTARRLQLYGNLLIAFTQRRRPPPDLCMIQNGFLLKDEEVEERLTKRIIRNRMVKYVVREPREYPEEEYVAKCKEEASNILLGDQEALNKLYGELAERYKDIAGHYVQITEIPWPKKICYPPMAYVELLHNSKPPLPKLPELEQGRLKTFPRDSGHHFLQAD